MKLLPRLFTAGILCVATLGAAQAEVPSEIAALISGWPQGSRLAADALLHKNGSRDLASSDALVWTGRRGRPQITVHRYENSARPGGVVETGPTLSRIKRERLARPEVAQWSAPANFMAQDKICVFLIDDHPIMREGVRSYLTSRSLSIIGEASDGAEALRKLKKLTPDVVVLDINLPDINGGELARRLRRLIPKAKIVAFSIHSAEAYVTMMARCGVHGYVVKDQPPVELFDAIEHVVAGGRYFPAGMDVADSKTEKKAVGRKS